MICKKCGIQINDGSHFCSNCGKKVKIKEEHQKSGKKWKRALLIIIPTFLCAVAISATLLYVSLFSYTLEMDFTATNFMKFIKGAEKFSDTLEISIVNIESTSNNNAIVTVEVIKADEEPLLVNFHFTDASQDYVNPGYDLALSADIYGDTDKASILGRVCEGVEKMLAHNSYIETDFCNKFGKAEYSNPLTSNYKLSSKYNVMCTYKHHVNPDSFNYKITTRIIP